MRGENALYEMIMSNALEIVDEDTFKHLLISNNGDLSTGPMGQLSSHIPTDISKELEVSQFEGYPEFDMESGGGILMLSLNDRIELGNSFRAFVSQNVDNDAVTIWGNASRGILDAAFLTQSLQSTGIPTTLRVENRIYRASSHAFGTDTQPRSIGESIHSPGWNIAVDSMTGKGPSIPMSIDFLHSLEYSTRNSVFLTFSGAKWMEDLPTEYCFNGKWDLGRMYGVTEVDTTKLDYIGKNRTHSSSYLNPSE